MAALDTIDHWILLKRLYDVIDLSNWRGFYKDDAKDRLDTWLSISASPEKDTQ